MGFQVFPRRFDSIRFEVSRDDGGRVSALNRVRCWEGGGRVDSLQVGEVRLEYILERREIQKFWRVFYECSISSIILEG